MDLVYMLLIQFIIQLLMNGNDSGMSLPATNIRCTSPFLSMFAIGFLQCQNECIRYSNCEVVRYSKSQLACYLYLMGNCLAYSGTADSNLYMRRDRTDERIGNTCSTTGCPVSNVCVKIQRGVMCFPDLVQTQNTNHNATFVDIDGVYFGLYPFLVKRRVARQHCHPLAKRLAILNTLRKRRIIHEETRNHDDTPRTWWIGAYINFKGTWLWNNGEEVDNISSQTGGRCGALEKGYIFSYMCNTHVGPFVCEEM